MAIRTTTTSPLRGSFVSSADHYDAVISIAELVRAYYHCRQNKRTTAAALAYERNLEANLTDLHARLVNGTYRPGRSICFVIRRPRPREVWAAEFEDRVVHHALYDRIGPRFERAFIADSCACIPGRGTLYAAKRLEAHIRGATQNWSRDCFYLKCDISSFFVSIDKRVLFEVLASRIPERWWLKLTQTILFHDPRPNVDVRATPAELSLIQPHKSLFNRDPGFGLPIGNLSSQFFANVLMDLLDQFIKHRVGARYYVRYVDDFVLLHESAQWLEQARRQIEDFLESRLHLRLNPTKTIVQPVSRGVDFVGQVVKPWHRTIRRRTANEALALVSSLDAGDLFRSGNSYLGLHTQATHGHHDRARLANLLRRRGHAVNHRLTKCYRKAGGA